MTGMTGHHISNQITVRCVPVYSHDTNTLCKIQPALTIRRQSSALSQINYILISQCGWEGGGITESVYWLSFLSGKMWSNSCCSPPPMQAAWRRPSQCSSRVKDIKHSYCLWVWNNLQKSSELFRKTSVLL